MKTVLALQIHTHASHAKPSTLSAVRRCSLILLALSLTCALTVQAHAQNNGGSRDDDEVIRVASDLVQLNVGVADRRGRAITDLNASDFVVYEDDVRQKITSFETVNAPFSLVLLLDLSSSTGSFRPTLKLAALRFIDALAPEDRVSVISFSDKPNVLTDFTSDRRKIGEAIEIAEGKGKTYLYDSLRFSLTRLAREGKRRKAVVVLTDGIDTTLRAYDGSAAKDATTNEAAIAAVKPENNQLFASVLNAADRQGVTIYPLSLPSGDPKKLLALTPSQAAIYAAARSRLTLLANRSGGRMHEIKRLENMGTLYAEVAADLRTLYTISYQPAATSTPPQQNNTNVERDRNGLRWRPIRIEVARPDTIARTRQGYYAP